MRCAVTAHGPDAESFLKASAATLVPEHFDGGLAFMFETSLMLKVTPWALGAAHRDKEYQRCWQQLPRVFDPSVRDVSTLTVKPLAADAAHAKGGDYAHAAGGGSASSSVDKAADGGEPESHKRRREAGGSGAN